MDRLIAPNSVVSAQADVAPATGTPQFATDGNPAANIPATQWPAYQYNAIQEELVAILVAAGITPDRTKTNQLAAAIRRLGQSTLVLSDTGAVNAYAATNPTPLITGASATWVDGVVQAVKIAHTNTGASTYAPDGLAAIPIYGLGLQPLQGNELLLNGTAILMHATIAGVNSGNPICVLMECAGGAQQIPPATASQHAVQLGQVGHGQCRLTYSSATTIKLTQFNGQNLIINGVPQAIPAAGVSLSNGGLSASTFYYVYAYMNAGVMTLEAVATTHVTGTNGVEQKSGDATRSLVGAVLTNSSSQFSATNNFYGIISWFNKQSISMQPVAAAGTLTSTSPTEINSGNRVTFISWLGVSVICTCSGFASDTISQSAIVMGVGFNSITATSGQINQANAPFAGAAVSLSTTFTPFVATENQAQYMTPLGQVSTGSGSFNVINSVTIQG
ncbi:hypothetical protein B0G76_1365 [Paraburkholderia sp. BL23I1N1]|uniref:hypothetical protein n=1 Tax=Paraburkholderia sp. BL23I1N1 TaxID=1938802 RepID=UPI000E768A0E|nr:hypothetical protein [Paraburkholderia sp. BL23I1N1]RKE35304.1 hypothetical protein B0G76_1365 [Paraburkholderia sp. BL23I1N1]